MGMSASDRREAAKTIAQESSTVVGFGGTVIVRDVISEGPIYGLVKGPASVFLNNQPLMNPASAPVFGSKTTTEISLTNGSADASMLNADANVMARLKQDENKIEFLTVRNGQGTIQVSLEVQAGDSPGIMKATRVSGKNFADSMVASWKGYDASQDEVLVSARIKGTAYTNYRDLEVTIVEKVSTSVAKIRLGNKNTSTTTVLLPEGNYTLEVDGLVDLKKVRNTNATALTAGGLAEVSWIDHAYYDPYDNYEYDNPVAYYESSKTGFDIQGPPYIVTEDASDGWGIRYRNFNYNAVTSISLGYEQDHTHYVFFGYFKPPTSGIYEFQLSSDDGAGMWIGNAASATREENEASGFTIRNKKSALIDIVLGGKTSTRTKSAQTEYLDSSRYYAVRLVHYNLRGPGDFKFEWRNAQTDDAFTTNLANQFYYPSGVVKDRNFVDLNNIELTSNWTGDSGTYKVDLAQGETNEEPVSLDYVQSNIKGSSVGFRVGDRFQDAIPEPDAWSEDQRKYKSGQTITVTPEPGVELKQHVNFATIDSPHDGVQDTIIQASAENGLDLTEDQIRNMDALRISIQYPNGMGQTDDKGRLKPTVAAYQIAAKFKNPGNQNFETPEYILIDELVHKYKRPNEDRGTKNAIQFNTDLPLHKFHPFSDVQIIIRRRTVAEHGERGYHYSGEKWKEGLKSGLRISANGVVGPCTAIISEKLAYPYTAYASTTYSTQAFKELPERRYLCKGLLVKVPSNYVTRDEATNGIASYTRNTTTGAITNTYQDWDGALRNEPVYTNNPAWVFYDIITNNRYGLGSFMGSSDIDIYALYRIARYCDELVEKHDGTKELEPRFTCNVYFGKQTDAYKVLKDLCTSFRSMLYWFDSQVIPVLDQPKNPVYNFTKGNVVNGFFSYESTGSKTRVNQIMVTWNNPANDYRTEGLLCEDKENIIKTGKVILQKAHAMGCTSYGQAKRYGRWKLWTALNQTEIVTFETALAARFLVPGDVINIQDSDRTRVRYSGRVSNTGTITMSQIPLDNNVTLKANHTYRLSVLLTTPAAFLAEASANIDTVEGGSPQSYVEGELVTHAWFYDGSSWNREVIDTETKATNARASTTATEGLQLSWAPYTRVETKDVSTSAGTTNLLNLSNPLSAAPEAEAIWVLEELTDENIMTEDSALQYKIMAIEEKENGTYNITAARHYNDKFSSIEDDSIRISTDSVPVKALPKEQFLPPISKMSISYTD